MNERVQEIVDAYYESEEEGIRQLFKKETGCTFLTYLTNYRIACAKHLLTSSTYRIHEISMMVGFADPKYFSKVFRKATGFTPVEWREQHH